MKKDTIVQFVCFITNLELDEFAPKWEPYAKRLMDKKREPALYQLEKGTKNKFRYISSHEWPDQDFQFSFMNERRSEHFPDHNVRVIQPGGYIAQEVEERKKIGNNDVRLIAFVSHNETDLEFYRELSLYHQLKIYQAFYESCSYGYVMEFYVPEKDAGELLGILNQRPGVETGAFRECRVAHA